MARKPAKAKSPAPPKGNASAPDATGAKAPAAPATEPVVDAAAGLAASAAATEAKAPAAGEAASSLQGAASNDTPAVEGDREASLSELTDKEEVETFLTMLAEDPANALGLTAEGWDNVDAVIRGALTAKAIEHIKAGFALREEVRQAVAAAAGPDVEVTAYAKHGKPYRRAGVVWTAAPQTVSLKAANAELVRNDPHLVVS